MNRIISAISFAADKHRNQRRKDIEASPYINHPIALANILANEASIEDEKVLVAAILHDTIEDTNTTAEELTAIFGAKITATVLDVTDDKSLDKHDRKQRQIEHAPHISKEAKLVKRMKKEGHIVGNHTVHHKSMPTLSDRDNKQEIIDCAQYCKEATGYDMDLFIRPPMGEYNERTLALTKKMGYRTIFWSMAYVDFKVDQQPGKDYVIEHFQKYTHKGAIPLIHNISRSNAEALETVIINLKKEGYRFEGLKKLPDY